MPTTSNSMIKLGSVDTEAVGLIKARLNQLGLSNLDVNNPKFGPETEKAVKQFQRLNNLLVDGIVGPLTRQLLLNPVVVSTPSSSILSLRAIEVAKTQLYVREATGHNDGKDIQKYLLSVGLIGNYPWCASFVYWNFNEAAKQLQRTNPLVKTGGVLDHWRRTTALKITRNPQVGDIFIMDFGNSKGHTGFIYDVNGNTITTLEGNTGADPTTKAEDREGDGVYFRSRKLTSFKGYIRYT